MGSEMCIRDSHMPLGNGRASNSPSRGILVTPPQVQRGNRDTITGTYPKNIYTDTYHTRTCETYVDTNTKHINTEYITNYFSKLMGAKPVRVARSVRRTPPTNGDKVTAATRTLLREFLATPNLSLNHVAAQLTCWGRGRSTRWVETHKLHGI